MVMNEAASARRCGFGDECEWSGVLVSSDKLLAVNVNTTDNRSKKLCYGTEGTGETYAFHSAGANHVFGDGSVRLLSSDVTIRIYAALVTRAGGETANAD